MLLTALALKTCAPFEKTADANAQKISEPPTVGSNRILSEENVAPAIEPAGLLADQIVRLGQKFVLVKGETAKIKGTDLEVKNASVGYTISEEADHEMFCGFSLDFKGESEEKTLSRNGSSVAFKNFRIRLVSLDTKKNTCGFVVTKRNR